MPSVNSISIFGRNHRFLSIFYYFSSWADLYGLLAVCTCLSCRLKGWQFSNLNPDEIIFSIFGPFQLSNSWGSTQNRFESKIWSRNEPGDEIAIRKSPSVITSPLLILNMANSHWLIVCPKKYWFRFRIHTYRKTVIFGLKVYTAI